MTRVCTVILLAAALLAHGLPHSAAAASKYNACGLLTAAELKAAVNASLDKADDRDIVIPSCTWAMGSTFASLNVIRGPQTAEQRAAGLSGMRTVEAGLTKKGWSVEPAKIPGADCNAYKPPASEESARPFASCIMRSKGLAFWLGVGGATSLTPQQVKGLADRIAARLP
jgi:hypothetical protein